MRGRFFRRIAIGVGVFFLFVFVAGWLGATFGGGVHGGRRWGPWFPVFPILLLIGFLAFGRVVRRTARPIGEVMDAAARVADDAVHDSVGVVVAVAETFVVPKLVSPQMAFEISVEAHDRQ